MSSLKGTLLNESLNQPILTLEKEIKNALREQSDDIRVELSKLSKKLELLEQYETQERQQQHFISINKSATEESPLPPDHSSTKNTKETFRRYYGQHPNKYTNPDNDPNKRPMFSPPQQDKLRIPPKAQMEAINIHFDSPPSSAIIRGSGSGAIATIKQKINKKYESEDELEDLDFSACLTDDELDQKIEANIEISKQNLENTDKKQESLVAAVKINEIKENALPKLVTSSIEIISATFFVQPKKFSTNISANGIDSIPSVLTPKSPFLSPPPSSSGVHPQAVHFREMIKNLINGEEHQVIPLPPGIPIPSASKESFEAKHPSPVSKPLVTETKSENKENNEEKKTQEVQVTKNQDSQKKPTKTHGGFGAGRRTTTKK